jgi:uncharacterized membrane protein YeaQ/YmgE (transglycosylase-associated protein family)
VEVIAFLLSLLVVGFVIGAVARLLLPGPDPMGCFATALLGIAGSFVGGLLADVVFGHSGPFHRAAPHRSRRIGGRGGGRPPAAAPPTPPSSLTRGPASCRGRLARQPREGALVIPAAASSAALIESTGAAKPVMSRTCPTA